MSMASLPMFLQGQGGGQGIDPGLVDLFGVGGSGPNGTPMYFPREGRGERSFTNPFAANVPEGYGSAEPPKLSKFGTSTPGPDASAQFARALRGMDVT